MLNFGEAHRPSPGIADLHCSARRRVSAEVSFLGAGPGQDPGMSSPPALPDAAFKLLDDACLVSTRGGGGVPPGLLPELQSIGCFHIDGPSNPIVLYSTR